jgi:hypothetical protein
MLALGGLEADIRESIRVLNDEDARVRTPTHSIATARRPCYSPSQ